MAANKKPKTAASPGGSLLDQRALRALFDTYWTAGGWRIAQSSSGQAPLPPAAEIEYAKTAGYMFDPRPMTHDQVVSWLCRVRDTVQQQQVTDAFLASLSKRRLDWRSALGSFAIARHFPGHRHSGKAAGACSTCNATGVSANNTDGDLSVLNFERFKWGGVRHLDPVYVALDLELFSKGEKPVPSAEDFAIMNRVLASIGRMDADARLDHLQKELGKHLASSKHERRILLQILGYCGIVQHPDHPGFLDGFIPVSARESASSRGDWSYPVEHWRGRHGLNQTALAFWFGSYKEIRR